MKNRARKLYIDIHLLSHTRRVHDAPRCIYSYFTNEQHTSRKHTKYSIIMQSTQAAKKQKTTMAVDLVCGLQVAMSEVPRATSKYAAQVMVLCAVETGY